MVKALPYPFKLHNACHCHKPCKSRLPMGAFIWVRALGGSDPWDKFRNDIRLDEFNGVGTCEWRFEKIEPFGIYTREYYSRFVWNPAADGTGIPAEWRHNLDVRTRLGAQVWDWSAFVIREEEDQPECNWLPDLTIEDYTVVPNFNDPSHTGPSVFLSQCALSYGWSGKSPFSV